MNTLLDDNAPVMIASAAERAQPMKITDLKTHDEVVAEWATTEPAFRAEWERTSLAHAISLIVLRYRSDHGLSQRALGELLGMTQPQVSRIESGDVNPSMDTLITLSARLGLELAIDIRPSETSARLLAPHVPATGMRIDVDTPRASIVVARVETERP